MNETVEAWIYQGIIALLVSALIYFIVERFNRNKDRIDSIETNQVERNAKLSFSIDTLNQNITKLNHTIEINGVGCAARHSSINVTLNDHEKRINELEEITERHETTISVLGERIPPKRNRT